MSPSSIKLGRSALQDGFHLSAEFLNLCLAALPHDAASCATGADFAELVLSTPECPRIPASCYGAAAVMADSLWTAYQGEAK